MSWATALVGSKILGFAKEGSVDEGGGLILGIFLVIEKMGGMECLYGERDFWDWNGEINGERTPNYRGDWIFMLSSPFPVPYICILKHIFKGTLGIMKD